VTQDFFVTCNAGETGSRYVFGGDLLFEEAEANLPVENFEVIMFVEVLRRAANIVYLPHEDMMLGTDEEFGPASELFLRIAGVREDQTFDAAAILVEAF
jgi:hypothetical protein